ncbi:MAG TPA: alpha/beta fold hydrolase [Longimicrobiaceae bacterium]|nr:alpha/beta fold hydrolase [Longimicrobiaceae bacterium]
MRATEQKRDWIDRREYPFESRYLDLPAGRMHYLDEGTGPVVLMVHGTPTWSYLYRHVVRELSTTHRCIVPDHLGFGLSDKPEGWSYRPEDHAANLAELIRRLDLRDLTLVVHDFGGPIGLSYAVEHPENVERLVLFNTWMWSQRGNASVEKVSRFVAGPVGRFLYTRLNFSPRVLVKQAFGDRSRLTKEVHRHYLRPFGSPAERQGPWVLGRELIGSSDFYQRLWERRDAIRDKPALLLWGMKDIAFSPADLARWEELFDDARTVRLEGVGHFPQEEAADRVLAALRDFLAAP